MRVGIREQLALLVTSASLIPLLVIAIATWVNNYNFVVGIQSSSLALTASLKAAEVAADLLLIHSTCATVATRVIIQNTLSQFYKTNGAQTNFTSAEQDFFQALQGGGISGLLQVIVFSRNLTGNPHGILNVTGPVTDIALPSYTYPNGSQYHLGDPGFGYPPSLYPNLTYTATDQPDPQDPTSNLTLVSAFPGSFLNASSVLLLGPTQINSSYALLSITTAIIDNQQPGHILGYMTVVASAATMIGVLQSREGLQDTGIALLLGPDSPDNHFAAGSQPATPTSLPSLSVLDDTPVKYVFPPVQPPGQAPRHEQYNNNLSSYGTSAFNMGKFPALVEAFGKRHNGVNNSSSILQTTNEQGTRVAVGYARPQSSFVDWLLVVEIAHSESWAPIIHLRNIILSCAFGTLGAVIIIVIPLAHFGVRPIRALRDATEKSISPPGYSESSSLQSDDEGPVPGVYGVGDVERTMTGNSKEKGGPGIWVRLKKMRRRKKRPTRSAPSDDHRRRVFKIPARVPDSKHWITDELTELTTTFNAMSDELLLQYSSLEEKVAERTQQLEISKKAAEAANESKTLFIANISHELKTPLNGILGMCAVCMGEDDLPRIKKSLQVVYKSGDLLLHLLDDVLTFSKNQIGQQLSLEEKEFRLSDIKTQVNAIFERQARESKISFSVKFVGNDNGDAPDISPSEKPLPVLGPGGLGRLKDLCLWGDQYRILQVMINLVSNSLKFTPEGGKIEVRIKCLGEAEVNSDQSRPSIGSKLSGRGSKTTGRSRGREGSQGSSTKYPPISGSSSMPLGTALVINPMDPHTLGENSPTPPPPGAKVLVFEFEVEDTGPGIPKHLQERVFEPFVQADLGLSRKYGGTGLGLSICSQLATLMGGDITLRSTEGVGSTFTMKIPLKFVKERAASTSSSDVLPASQTASIRSSEEILPGVRTSNDVMAAAATAATVSRGNSLNFNKDSKPRLVGLSQPFFASGLPSPGQGSKEPGDAAQSGKSGRIRVLVAEDNLVNQEVVLRMLKLEDVYDVVVAKDGQEAYDVVKESMEKGELFNLIFMDIQMPNLDGLQSTRLIRQMGYSAPIVALTAFSEESNVKECYDSGMDMFLR